MFFLTLLLCPLFIFIILKSIFLFFNKKFIKISVSILVSILDLYIFYCICNFMGWYYPVSYYVFILLNLSVIILINIIKYFAKSKHKKVIIFLFSALLIISGLISIFKYIIENNRDIIAANSNDIINNFNIYGIDAGKEYKGKIVEINGIIIDKAFPKDFRPLWNASCIYFGNNIDEGTKIACYFDDIMVHDLEIGQEVTVRCKFKKYSEYQPGNNIKFIKGKILNN